MVSTFFEDLSNARAAEHIVLDKLSSLTNDYTFTDCANNKNYWHKGDIIATDADGAQLFIEVKDDSRIHETGNVLCEYAVEYYETGKRAKGGMFNETDIYCVVSQPLHKIYVFDFERLKKVYLRGKYKVIPHAEQTTYCYLNKLEALEKCGALVGELDY